MELSIIIPVLHEEGSLEALFAMLGRQRAVSFELILVDGGSTDATLGRAQELAGKSAFPCRIVSSKRGRARQQNAGVRLATAETLLFLHADCAFIDPLALQRGLAALGQALARRGDDRVAGHFALSFALPAERYGFGYYFYESKARLDRSGCTHGDQGFMLRRSFFAELGQFDETLSLLEDNRLAEAVRREGQWLLLPAEVLTSARRFETEGLHERQLLNALIMNFAAIGWEDFFRAAPGAYRCQTDAGKLRLVPFFRVIRGLLRSLPLHRRLALWLATGGYVRENAWQLAFAMDARRAFRRGLPPGEGETPLLTLHERWFDRCTDNAGGRLITALLVWSWFHLTYLLRVARGENG